MASNEDVMQQFVVALGFKTDEGGAKKMESQLVNVAQSVAGVTAALGAMALAATAAVAKIAGAFNTLYYESGRVGSSVGNLKAMQYAFSQVGGSADQARSVIESFSRATRTNPGLVKFVKDLGVDVNADKWDQVLGVVEKLRAKPYYIASQQAEMLGIDENSYNLLSRQLGQLRHYQAERKRIAASVGLDDTSAAEASKKFSQALGTLTATAEVVAVKIATVLMPPITKFMKDVGDWIEKHPREIEEAVRAIGAFALAVAVAFGHIAKVLAPVAEAFAGMVKMLGENGQLETAMMAFAVFLTATWVPKILGAFGLIGGGWAGLLAKLGITAAAFAAGSSIANNGVRGTDAATGGAMEKPPMSLEGNEGWAQKYLKRGWGAVKRAFGGGEANAAGSNRAPLGPVPAGLLDNIARAEGTYRTGYNTSLAHGRFLPGGKEQDLTSKSLSEILALGRYMRRQRGNPNSSALGRYQIVGSTLKDAAKALGMDLETTKFDEKTQDQMAHWIARRQGLGAWEGFKGHPSERAAAAAALARQDRSGGTGPAKPIVLPFNSGTAGGFNPGSFDVNRLGAAPMGSVSNTDASRSVTQHIKQEVKVDGGGDPARAASMMERSFNRMNQASLENARTIIR